VTDRQTVANPFLVTKRRAFTIICTSQQFPLALFAIGMVGLGILAIVYGDFALVWQPVASWVPGRTSLAYASGLLMLFGGVGLLFRATAAWSIRVLFPYLFFWLLLKVPAAVVAPTVEAVWLGVGELCVLFAGGWVLFARLADLRKESIFTFATGQNGIRIARVLFAVSLIPIGLSHLVYTKETAALVPGWLPYRNGWAYLTGAGQIACGVGVMSSICPCVAAVVEAGMLSVFTLLVWIPAVSAAPTTRLPWTALCISWAITAGAWVVAGNVSEEVRTTL